MLLPLIDMKTRDFDKEAAGWDSNPARVKLAGDIGHVLVNKMKLTRTMEVLDFGCGSGLLTLFIAPLVKTVIALDSSQGMLDVLEKKLICQNINNVKVLFSGGQSIETLIGKYDLIVSSMALHHVEDAMGLVSIFYKHLLPDGIVAIADLDLDDGEFHEDSTGIFHNGFDRSKLKIDFENIGFRNVSLVNAATVEKSISGILKKFTIFLIMGKK